MKNQIRLEEEKLLLDQYREDIPECIKVETVEDMKDLLKAQQAMKTFIKVFVGNDQ